MSHFLSFQGTYQPSPRDLVLLLLLRTRPDDDHLEREIFSREVSTREPVLKFTSSNVVERERPLIM